MNGAGENVRLLLPESRKTNTDGLSSQWTVACRGVEDGLKNHEKQQQTIDSPPMDGDDTHFWGQKKTEETKGPPCPRNRYQKPHPTSSSHPL